MNIRLVLSWRLLALILLPGSGLFLVGNQAFHNNFLRFHLMDLRYYYRASAMVLTGHLPYRDFALAYPPLSLVSFLLPHLAFRHPIFDLDPYIHAFLLESVLWVTIMAVLLARMTARWTFPLTADIALGGFALLTLTFSSLLPWRYDLFPTVLTLAALYCLLAKRPLAAGVWLGLGVAAKLYPLVLLPVFGLYLLAQGQRRNILKLTLGFAGALGVCVLPFLRVPPSVLFSFLTFHQQRGLEVESLSAGAILAARALGWCHAGIVFNYGAYHLVSPAAPVVLKCLPAAFALMYGWILARAWQTFRADIARQGTIQNETLARFVLAALLTFLACNKVFSTSYVIWLLPFAPLLRPREAVQMLALFGLTILIYPFNFDDILRLNPLALLLLNGRNLFLLALLFQLSRPYCPAENRQAAQLQPAPLVPT